MVTLDDRQGRESLVLETPAGQRVTLGDGPSTITVEDANGNRVVMNGSSIAFSAAAKLRIDAPQVEISAGMVKVDSALAEFSGIVKCQMVQTTAVVSTSYTPGAGNIW